MFREAQAMALEMVTEVIVVAVLARTDAAEPKSQVPLSMLIRPCPLCLPCQVRLHSTNKPVLVAIERTTMLRRGIVVVEAVLGVKARVVGKVVIVTSTSPIMIPEPTMVPYPKSACLPVLIAAVATESRSNNRPSRPNNKAAAELTA